MTTETTYATPEAVRFFYEHAGYSYNPNTETMEQGRQRGAVELAEAEMRAEDRGITFEVLPEDHDPDWGDIETTEAERAATLHLMVLAYGPTCHACGAPGPLATSLGGILIPEDDDSYLRVVKAELAAEVLAGS